MQKHIQSLRLICAVLLIPFSALICLLISLQRQLYAALHTSSKKNNNDTLKCLSERRGDNDVYEQKQHDKLIAVIIPTYNVENHIRNVIQACLVDPNVIVFVSDGGSTDNTRDIVSKIIKEDEQHQSPERTFNKSSNFPASRVQLIHDPLLSGRSTCMNSGAYHAIHNKYGIKFDILFFLHGDTYPPKTYGNLIRSRLLSDDVVGAFYVKTIGLDRKNDCFLKGFRILANWLNNKRSEYMEVPYGDQGYFMKCTTFQRIGGYPPVPLMEDVAFIRKVQPGCVVIDPSPICTFAGSWNILGPLFVISNYMFLTLYLTNIVTCEQLFHLYYPGRKIPNAMTYQDITTYILKKGI